MSDEIKSTGCTRRDFVKTVGLAGLAVAGAGVPAAMAAGPARTPNPSRYAQEDHGQNRG